MEYIAIIGAVMAVFAAAFALYIRRQEKKKPSH